MRPVLLWDVMGTLVHDPFFVEMPAFFGMSFQDMLAAKHPGAWVEFEVDQRSQDSFLQDFFEDRRVFDHADFINTIQSSYRWLEGMEALLSELRDRECTMHAFSNYPRWYKLIENKLSLSRYLDWTFVSCLTGIRKPDAAAYARVLETLGVAPGDCVFVDDRTQNCDAAKETGMHAIVFQDAVRTRASLHDVGVL